ncbi:MAG: class I SAM-dependent methyltransferase [Acidobacteria bacterium]|nr:class I SAM-dependent methyltransferase [Acidobacteriota bacterium]
MKPPTLRLKNMENEVTPSARALDSIADSAGAEHTDRDLALLCLMLRRMWIPESTASLLLAHAAAVARGAMRLGLISPRDEGAVVSRHTADSLLFALARPPVPRERWVDVGSGAGFPGLALACCYPETEFVLAEPLRRRAGFLELTVASLGLENAEVRSVRLPDANPDPALGGEFDVAVARALADPSESLKRLLDVVRQDGEAIVAAGRSAQIPSGAREVEVKIEGVDSPGRLFIARRAVSSSGVP